MKILQKNTFQKVYKKLHHEKREIVDQVIRDIFKNPLSGEKKVGDLADVYVIKFKMISQLTLLAYTYDEKLMTLTLLALGVHENFYRDLKNT